MSTRRDGANRYSEYRENHGAASCSENWTLPDVAILDADQKERGRHQPVGFPTKVKPVYPEDFSNGIFIQ